MLISFSMWELHEVQKTAWRHTEEAANLVILLTTNAYSNTSKATIDTSKAMLLI
jgi:hypothetical protein